MRHSLTAFGLLGLSLCLATPVSADRVTVETQLGSFEIELFEDEAPNTVANFLNYVRDGRYEANVVHRNIEDFVLQTGSFRIVDDLLENIPTDDPVVNEFGRSNLRGTVAMAKLGGDPDSATSGWFVNLADNSENLDNQNGGFTVFGEVVGNGMEVVDAISALPTFRINGLGAAFTDTPLYEYTPGEPVRNENFVLATVTENSDFVINSGLNDAWFNPATAGQGFFFNVFPDQGLFFLSWFTFDTERPPGDVTAILGEPGHRWITAQGSFSGNVATLDATLTSGGVFDAALPAVENDAYGTVTVTFEGCNAASVAYDFPVPGVSGTVPVRRVVADNVALCEALQEDSASR
ncbi:MAG: peptidylprolyl isomerase [Xanthomonadales bacterium]|jgi:cyclophilin family peptidyl-prolyl cis-trans isomerase|nr:peptidylprolyl isomerase [Xanthomonadales bacterium]